MQYEWVKDAVTPPVENQESHDLQNVTIQDVASQKITMQSLAYHPALSRWYEAMSAGRQIKGLAHEFPEPERIMLEPRQVKSLLAFPILLEGRFWGFVGFEDCHCQRIWTGADVSILQASVVSISGAIIRKQAEDDLREAKDAAEASAVAKSQFMANMSHELRTPMNAVIGMTSLLLDGELTSDQRTSIEIIRSSGQDLMFLINGILDFAKLGEGKVELESQPFELYRCIEETIELRASAASEKGLELSCTFDREAGDIPDMILGDPTRIRQVLGNLLDNAIKFTDRGAVQVIVSSKVAGDCSQILFAVKDTGIGIPQDQMHKLFLPFSQVDCTSTSKYAGTGLGLAASQKLVELMGGRIWVESEIGKGSTFHFTILAKKVKEKQATANNKKIKECLPSGLPAPLRILLAEDNDVNQLVMLKMLKRLGCRADIAANGIEAIQAMKRQPYDIVLMDVKMPEMDGLQATRIIRKLWPQGPKIVAITAYALQGDRERCLEAGMDGYISKPVKMEELAKVLANAGCLGASREPNRT